MRGDLRGADQGSLNKGRNQLGFGGDMLRRIVMRRVHRSRAWKSRQALAASASATPSVIRRLSSVLYCRDDGWRRYIVRTSRVPRRRAPVKWRRDLIDRKSLPQCLGWRHFQFFLRKKDKSPLVASSRSHSIINSSTFVTMRPMLIELYTCLAELRRRWRMSLVLALENTRRTGSGHL